ncbi:MAG: pyridoxamine 5'-phosphate oxidase [Flavobacteriales bacterium]|nr:MAG: pyridoxamine 5'-phosphate oxidase [Flavobacteriales bacterium]
MSKHIKRLKDDHKDFDYGDLGSDFESNPILAFQKWFDEACEKNESEPNAFCLSTIDETGKSPSSRIVYLKDLRNDELVFYTNYNSDKGQQIHKNPNACILFFWPGLQRQVRIQGVLSKIPDIESDVYFNSRPRSSQIGAWASQQSMILSGPKELEDRVKEIESKYPDRVPRPEFWGGYALRPNYFEFWQGRPSRLHDRVCFDIKNGNWTSFRKNP